MTQAAVLAQRLHELFEYRDGNFYRKNSVQGHKAGNKSNFVVDNGYEKLFVDGKKYRQHRMVFLYHNRYIPQFIDHINGIRCDNRIENLRPATKSQNRMNVGLTAQNTSGIKNVMWMKKSKCWRVQVKPVNQKPFVYETKDIELAELVAIEARAKFHGEYANHGVMQ